MIPKIIHYCWFGPNPKSDLIQRCIHSWKQLCPDYEIMEWNESNFDISTNKYCQQAYNDKRYAYVSDIARLVVLLRYGGIYLDTDVELLKPLDDLLYNTCFMGAENDNTVNTGLILGAEANHPFIKSHLEYYETAQVDYAKPCTVITSELLGLSAESINDVIKIKGVTIYPSDYFCPLKNIGRGPLELTDNSFSIHHYSLSWWPDEVGRKKFFDELNYKKRQKIMEKIFGGGGGSVIS